jgi:23S rRNA (pseudouridine1915-N3)-methyltransferase
MEIRIVTLGRRATRKHAAAEELFASFCHRIGHYSRCQAENHPTEEKFFAAVDKPARTLPRIVLLDTRGKTFSTEQLADWLRRERDQSTQQIVFAVGPANGWSVAARKRAGLLLSLGPMTLPHELAAVVLAEQIYRAFTIIEGHPYHLGHT